jgi:16S rRNA (guanine527-N7)-methyltransferase
MRQYENIESSVCGLVYNAHSMKDVAASTVSTEQITELLTPFLDSDALTDSQLLAIKSYLDLLLKWNAKLNLTAIRNPREMVTRHFGESLFAARQLFPLGDSSDSVIDVGSGAGFPGLPIKLWSPQVELTLIESNQRKATFLRELIRALDLKSVSVVTERAESVSFKASLVTLRAVEQFERVLPAALGLVMPGGRIGLLIGEAQVDKARSLSTEVDWQSPSEIPLSNSRRLLIGQKLKS